MNKNISSIIGIVIALILFIAGMATEVPSRSIGYDYREYVGGDAYNFIIEASIRGGEIAGAETRKAVMVSASAIIFVISILGIKSEKKANGIQTSAVNISVPVQPTVPQQPVMPVTPTVPTQPSEPVSSTDSPQETPIKPITPNNDL